MSSLAGYVGGRRPLPASQSLALLQKRKRKRIERRIGHLLGCVAYQNKGVANDPYPLRLLHHNGNVNGNEPESGRLGLTPLKPMFAASVAKAALFYDHNEQNEAK